MQRIRHLDIDPHLTPIPMDMGIPWPKRKIDRKSHSGSNLLNINGLSLNNLEAIASRLEALLV